jgi:uncharacterized membrane protein YcaP (DUF421 family)
VDSVIRAAAMYFVLMLVFRIAGRRTLSEMTSFDFVLLLIVSEATQQALIDEDNSFTGAALVILTLVGIDIALSLLKRQMPRLERWIDGTPTLLVADGRPMDEVMRRARVDVGDVLAAARQLRGLERLDQIQYAVLECNGGITIIPKTDAR